MMSKRRLSLGARGEAAAADYLTSRGYAIVAQNYRCSVGEIDLIIRKDGCLIVCEVKTRWSSDAGETLEAVTYRKQKRLRRLGEYYWQFETDRALPLRFDVLALCATSTGFDITHLTDILSPWGEGV